MEYDNAIIVYIMNTKLRNYIIIQNYIIILYIFIIT